MKTILCPTDFSACSQNAALYAAELAKEFDSLLILIHVFESPLMYTDLPVVTITETDISIKNSAAKNIARLKDRLLGLNRKLRVETIIIEGDVSKEVRIYADKVHADLVVMGNTGKGNAERTFIGSTSSQLITKTHCPVLCVPKRQQYNGINKIVYATDLQEDNLKAAQAIVPFARKFHAEIQFVYVDAAHLIHSDENILDMTKKIRSHIRYNKISGFIAKNPRVTDGLEYFLRKNPADMLVMFTHQRKFPISVLHPSVTKRVSHRIKTPMLALVVPVSSLA